MGRRPSGFWTEGQGYEIVKAWVTGEVDTPAAVAALRRAGVTQTMGRTDDAAFVKHLLKWYGRDVRDSLGLSRKREDAPSAKVRGVAGAQETVTVERVTIGQGGRLVIPAQFRDVLGLGEGAEVILRIEEGELRLTTPEQALRRAQALVRQFVPANRSLADELIAERRREARRE